jgi:cadmium resistance protein CadD (predicted permease)
MPLSRMAFTILNGVILLSTSMLAMHAGYRYLPFFIGSTFPYLHAILFCFIMLIVFYMSYEKVISQDSQLKSVTSIWAVFAITVLFCGFISIFIQSLNFEILTSGSQVVAKTSERWGRTKVTCCDG